MTCSMKRKKKKLNQICKLLHELIYHPHTLVIRQPHNENDFFSLNKLYSLIYPISFGVKLSRPQLNYHVFHGKEDKKNVSFFLTKSKKHDF